MTDHPHLSVVVPCFNEAAVLHEFSRRMTEVCRSLDTPYEIVFVDDGSTDATFEVLLELVRQPQIVIVRLLRNHGHQAAASAGLSAARGKRVLLIDADLQDPPECLVDMMRLMDEGADVVYGRRIRREGESAFKKLTAHLFYRLLSRLSATEIPRDTGDFRLMRRRIVDVLAAMPEQQRFIRGMVSWVGGQQIPLDYVRHPRLAGETKYPLIKMINFAADAITSFSVKPLRAASWMAAMSGFVALLLVLYSLIQWRNGTLPGWASLMTALCIFSSLQFLMLGIIGEYVGRTFIELKRRPLFLVDRIISAGGATFHPPMDWSALTPTERHRVLDDLQDRHEPDSPVLHVAAAS